MDQGEDFKERSARLLVEALSEFGTGAFATSSFQTQGVPLLHLIHLHVPELPIWFIDTGFHFAETLFFKRRLIRLWNLRVRTVQPSGWQSVFERDMLWETNSDKCCEKLKVRPMQSLLKRQEHSCWISGVRAGQTTARQAMNERETGPHGVTRVHPMIHWTGQQIEDYINDNDCPRHPLWAKGYDSVGCWPCTVSGCGRNGRWPGQVKEGCGIHQLIQKKTC